MDNQRRDRESRKDRETERLEKERQSYKNTDDRAILKQATKLIPQMTRNNFKPEESREERELSEKRRCDDTFHCCFVVLPLNREFLITSL